MLHDHPRLVYEYCGAENVIVNFVSIWLLPTCAQSNIRMMSGELNLFPIQMRVLVVNCNHISPAAVLLHKKNRHHMGEVIVLNLMVRSYLEKL